MARKTSPAIALYRGGIHGRVDKAVRPDGAVFVRYMDKGRYGWSWGKWMDKGQRVDPENLPGTMEAGFSTLYPGRQPYDPSPARLRLPLA